MASFLAWFGAAPRPGSKRSPSSLGHFKTWLYASRKRLSSSRRRTIFVIHASCSKATASVFFSINGIWPSTSLKSSLNVESKARRLIISVPHSWASERQLSHFEVTLLLNCAARRSYFICNLDTSALRRKGSLVVNITGHESRHRCEKKINYVYNWRGKSSVGTKKTLSALKMCGSRQYFPTA